MVVFDDISQLDTKCAKYYQECIVSYQKLQKDKAVPPAKKLNIIIDQIEQNHNLDDV